jgi:hypothetical protein
VLAEGRPHAGHRPGGDLRHRRHVDIGPARTIWPGIAGQQDAGMALGERRGSATPQNRATRATLLGREDDDMLLGHRGDSFLAHSRSPPIIPRPRPQDKSPVLVYSG